MATVTGLTKERMEEIEAASIVDGAINGSGHLILTNFGGDDIDAGAVLGSVPAASDTVAGLVELATNAETIAGADATRAVTPAGLNAAVGTLVPDATTSVKGKVELATNIEALAGIDSARAITPSALSTVLAALFQTIYPVGSVYISTASTNPASLFGFGTWVAIQGRVLIGVDGVTYTAGATGGAATKTLSTAEMPSHTHTASTGSDAHTHNVGRDFDGGSGSSRYTVHNTGSSGAGGQSPTSSDSHSHSVTVNATGSGNTFSILPPYLAVYIWKRTA